MDRYSVFSTRSGAILSTEELSVRPLPLGTKPLQVISHRRARGVGLVPGLARGVMITGKNWEVTHLSVNPYFIGCY